MSAEKGRDNLKKVLKVLLLLLALLAAAALAYAAYVFIAYHRVEDRLPITPEGTPQEDAIPVGEEQTLLSFNIGFGAYEPDFGFFMDGGTESWAFSEERLQNNLDAIRTFLSDCAPDLLLMQEVDEYGTRTYHINERKQFEDGFSAGYQSVWAQNWDSPFLFYPFTQPHGANRSGILTFSRYPVTDAMRFSLPVEDSLMKIVDLDRCYSVSRIPTDNGRELVLYNVHLSAYTSDGTVAVEQLRILLNDMCAEYEKGNYAVCGGDFNKDLYGDSSVLFGVPRGEDYSWAQPLPMELLDDIPVSLCVPGDPENPVPSCRNADSPYHDGQYVLTIDGFFVTDNVTVRGCSVKDTGFRYSDHNPVALDFCLDPAD